MTVLSAPPLGRTAAEPASVEARRDGIASLVRQRGFVPIEALARQFGVTVQTIRRDLNKMSAEGRLERYHGGAGLPSSVENIDYSMRQVMNLAEKERIARLVAAHVPAHASLFINIGTTTEAVARALVGHQDLRVITNNLNVATTLANATDFKIIVTGGQVRNRDNGLIGPVACDTIGHFRVDFGIIGISGIDADGTLLDFDYDEVRVAQAILRNARQTFLVVDHSKFGRRPMVRMGSITEVAAVFSDEMLPPAIRTLLADHGVALHVASH
ncbi:glycerol-3-phosphate regulon repressor [Blastochloris viridis]|uniref:Glycerol-3-phosphate regulon repressor n=1 Tax=Blastochloris viridis TaxID=1079 RepID=A0A182D1S4_BLAVI|nr:glycerol-3-phosphate regulon repressor [Blastochloris viridis]